MKRSSQRILWGIFTVVLAVIIFLVRFGFQDQDESPKVIWSRFQTARLNHRMWEICELLPHVDLCSHLSEDELDLLAVDLLEDSYISASDHVLTAALAAFPKSRVFHRRLGALKHHTGRRVRAQEHWRYLLNYGGIDLLTIPLIGNAGLRLPDVDRALIRGNDERHDDPLVYLGLADRSLQQHEFKECRTYVRRALELSPDLLEAHLCAAELDYQQGNIQDLQLRLQSMSESVFELGQYWVLCGHVWRHRDDVRSAARCYWEALRRDSLYYEAVSGLGHCMQEMGQTKDAAVLKERARLISEYADRCRSVHFTHDIVERSLQRAEEAAAQLSCYRDASAWCQLAAVAIPLAGWPRERLEEHQSRVRRSVGRSQSEDDLLSGIDMSVVPLPRLLPEQRPIRDLSAPAVPLFCFEDIAKSAGIRFEFEDGANPVNGETALFEFTGGGVAILDYDRDGWPDLFFPQGGVAPVVDAANVSSIKRSYDTMFRNIHGASCENVTQFLGLEDHEYGQGVSVGDFNSDGWPDLYVANVGRNVLYQNNGDGTLSPLNDPIFWAAASWTTSCALVDLNRDGLPDLYDCNYVSLADAHTLMCRSGDASVPCQKGVSPIAAQDQILLNLGDGSFSNVTKSTGIVQPEGLALGLIAADWDGNGSLDLFIANDARPNFLFMNQSLNPLKYSEEAVLRGVALSGTGRAQACMGIAADDFTGQGRVDLFVTNFYADYNTFYRALPNGLFRDETSERGLHELSYFFLGFGTQSLDADLDGHPDIVLTNGDVVDFSAVNLKRKYKQPAQFLWNQGSGRFQEVSRTRLGGYFQAEQLGRGLAVLDFDRDGREDFAVSHIGSPAALVNNRTSVVGHWLVLQLVGVQSERDAIGAKITVNSSGRIWHKQLLGGNGYMASNQRRILVGLGENQMVDSVSVTWPSGEKETFGVLAADCEYLLIEGTRRAITGAIR